MNTLICPLISTNDKPCSCVESKCAWWSGTGCAIAELPNNLSEASDAVRDLQDGLVSIASEINGIV